MTTYFVATLAFLPLWLLLFFYRGDKKEQILWSIGGAILGPFVQIMHLQEWWMPKFMCPDCLIKVEDLLFGFLVGGISAVIYNDFFVSRKSTENLQRQDFIYRTGLAFGAIGFTFLPFYFFRIHSFYTSLVGLGFLAVGILIKRPDLFKGMVVSGCVLTVYSSLAYALGLIYHPGWITDEWMIDRLMGVFFLGVPIEEFFWYFMVGFGMSAYWEAISNIKYLK